MSKEEPVVGERYYTADGLMVVLVGRFDGQYTVCACYEMEDGDEEPRFGNPFLTSGLFKKPPVECREKAIAELENRRVYLRDDIATIKKEREEELKKTEEASKRMSKFRCLDGVLDFLEGNFKFFVFPKDFKILTWEEALQEKDEYSGMVKNLKMLSLKGTLEKAWNREGPIGKVSWQVSGWSDGSGSSTSVVPAKTLDEARAVLQEAVTREANSNLKTRNCWSNSMVIGAAKRFALSLPEGFEEGEKKRNINNLRAFSEKKKVELADALEALRKAESGDEA